MPIVFVHGVNNRDGKDYKENESARNGFLRELVGPAWDLTPEKVQIFTPYWGRNGATFAWNMAVLPDPDDTFETFGRGLEDGVFSDMVSLLAESKLDGALSLVENARIDFAGVVEMLYAAAMSVAESNEAARELARSYLRASTYASENPSPSWLATAQDTNFVDQLENETRVVAEETFGVGGIRDALKEGWSRLLNVLPDAGSTLVGRLVRKELNASLTLFAGDAFTYLARRGNKEAPGEIVTTVLSAIKLAIESKNADDHKLIVIAHSFGGQIVYDILSHFEPGIEVDCLVTVGSQVGLFEEMKLYAESKLDVPLDPSKGKVPRPQGLKRWLNVFDLNDVLSFRVEPVFADTSDYAYDTGYSSLSAHGGYFLRPSFYKRLATRLKKG